MGLGITAWFHVGQSRETTKENYERYFKEITPILPHGEIQYSSDERGFCVKLVHFEEDIYCDWEDGRLRVSAKTNSAGPGYHAYVAELIDGLGPVSVEDETGYYETRDFPSLQFRMQDWLKTTSEVLLGMDNDYRNIAVSLPIGRVPETQGHFTSCPLGHFGKDFFERVKKGEKNGSEFFVWWNQEQDALFFRNAALNSILCDVNWLTPETDSEFKCISLTLACLEKAYALNPRLEYPAAEWLELAELAGDEALTKTLKSRFGNIGEAVLGYNRGTVTSLVGKWRVSHSGKMHFDIEGDGSTVYWDDRRTIRLATMTVGFKEEPSDIGETKLADMIASKPGVEPFKLRNEKIVAGISHKQIEENGELLWYTALDAALGNELLIVSLFYVDDDDREWAVKICASVTGPQKGGA